MRSLDDAHFELLRLLHVQPQCSQRGVASRLGMSVGKTNHCLHALIDLGLVKAQNFRTSSNKLSYLYVLTPAGVRTKAQLTRDFLARRVREYELLRAEIEQLTIESRAAGSHVE
jgi:MarR family transcriptional regulator, temperature-dependent positive regulator of motility